MLGALLLHNDAGAFERIRDTLQPEDFFLAKHRRIFRSILETYDRTSQLDLVLVAADLERQGTLAEAGGRAELLDLTAGVASSAAVEYHAALVTEHAERRKLLELCARLQVRAQEGAAAAELRAMLEAATASMAQDAGDELHDWRAIAEQPPVPWLVDGIVPRGGLVVLAGDPGSGKSCLAHDMALRAAHGLDWLGRCVNPCSTLILAGEGTAGLPVRMRAWLAANPGAIQTNGRYVVVHRGVPDLASLVGAAALQRMPDRLRQERGHVPGLIVIDTLALALRGADENESRAVGAVLGTLADVQREHGCAILLIHHARKPTGDRTSARTQHDLRGSSAIAGAADIVLLAETDNEARTLRVVKSRDSDTWPPIRYQVVAEETGLTLENGRRELGPILRQLNEKACPTPSEPPEIAQQRQHADDVERVVAALNQLGAPASSIDQIVALAGLGKTRGRPAVHTAVSRGRILREGTSRQPQFCVRVQTPPVPPVGAGRRALTARLGARSRSGRRSGADRASGVDEQGAASTNATSTPDPDPSSGSAR